MATTKNGHAQYCEPSERLARYGYASSFLNGNTIEGGLRSVTYKSIYALKLVEELNLAKNVIVPSDMELIQLHEHKIGSDKVASLREELQVLASKRGTRDTSADQMVDLFNSQLDKELLEDKSISEEYQSKLLEICGNEVTDSSVTFKRFISNEPVATMEEVVGFDGTMYLQAAERRREEERLENERLALEAQKLEEEALLEELKFREQEKNRMEADQFRLQPPVLNLAMINDSLTDIPQTLGDLSFNLAADNLAASSNPESCSTTSCN